MKVFITGGTGFLGAALTRRLLSSGHAVSILTRSAHNRSAEDGVSFIEGDPTSSGRWQGEIKNHDVVINLAGASIFRYWNARNKKAIYESRILTTRNIVEAIRRNPGRPISLLSGSAVGFYGFSEEGEFDENGPPGDDFLATVVRDWEAEARKAEQFGARVVLCRIGVILGRDGGALSKMVKVFNLGMGSRLGSGKQWFSWISLQDLVSMFIYLMKHEEIAGPVNCTAPNPVTNREMTRALGAALGRPVFLPPVPAFLLKGVMGEFSNVFVRGQKVLPGKMQESGFEFEFPEIQGAFEHLV